MINGLEMDVSGRVDSGRLGQRVGFWVGLAGMTTIDTRSYFIVATVTISVIGLALGRLNRNDLGRHKILVDITRAFGVGGRSWIRFISVRGVGRDSTGVASVVLPRARSVRSRTLLNN